MQRTCLAFVFTFIAVIAFPSPAPAQPNSEKASQVTGPAPEPPTPPKAVKDSLKAARAKSKKAKAAAKDTAAAPAAPAAAPAVPSPAASPTRDSLSPVPAPDSAGAALPAPDSAQGRAGSVADSAKPPEAIAEAKAPLRRIPLDPRLFNDATLVGKEYGFGCLFSVVAGTLGFFIGSGIETAIQGENHAHKGTLSFTGIRYDNFQGAFWGGATGMITGSALATYFTGQLDEEDGGFFATLAGTTAAAAGAFYLASLMGVNDEIDWKPFLPLVAIPSIGGTLGFNVSRWFHDREREKAVAGEAAVRWHAPSLAWGLGPRGERVQLQALRLTF